VISYSKIRIFFITLTSVIILGSCHKKNDVIPTIYVDFNISINDPQFVDLVSIGGSVTVNRYTNNIGQGAAGFLENGIIIHSGASEYFAYDRTCPHDYTLDGSSIQVNIDPDNSLFAICPKCSTSYALPAGGTPSSGVGRYPLKNYRANFDGRYIWVSNY
jgi:nitrite reductase/ring-hydroxylating ferredoxin subunit